LRGSGFFCHVGARRGTRAVLSATTGSSALFADLQPRFTVSMIAARMRGANAKRLSLGNEIMETLEQRLQRIHDVKIGVTITWLWDGGVDLQLLRERGAVAAKYRTSLSV
jgi:hypothetical protein